MHFDEIQRLVQLIEESDVDELDVWRWWGRIRIRKNAVGTAAPVVAHAPVVHAPASAPAEPSSATAPAAEAPSASEPEEAGTVPIKSPMVGTMYHAASPDAPPYVKVGDVVEPGQTVCIVEAMKLMNEIQAEVRGTITKILVDNAQPVEFGQPLFLVKEN
ncbi:MAG: acetyl-CoA carboxylase biotin carboxyl carrier protein [Candidatus Eisenbacteria bacterium]|uniref:Biotin carboxyl carrier protein of acetyl-CoA carboxylase n=1 Tax=Eiseniibacteriota bacterium TaxID=2212470 RepID=A0A7Y2H235_UNCEI|nr:acetyl-CoA carboxylase biotin carboxyl carrier protein [Candidatus Eisenbacteria bacterium]